MVLWFNEILQKMSKKLIQKDEPWIPGYEIIILIFNNTTIRFLGKCQYRENFKQNSRI